MGKRVKAGETVVVDVKKGGEVRAEAKEGEEEGFVLRPGRMEGGNDAGLRLDFWGVKVLMPWGEIAPVEEQEQKVVHEDEKMAEATALKLAREDRSSSPLTEEEDAEMEEEVADAASEDGDDAEEEEEDGSEVEEDNAGRRRGGGAQPFSSLPPSSPPAFAALSLSRLPFLPPRRCSPPELTLPRRTSVDPLAPPTLALLHLQRRRR